MTRSGCRYLLPGVLAVLLLAGCASRPTRGPDAPAAVVPAVGAALAANALALLGRPYRYGGNGPEAFDCSGLVRYVHQRIGLDVPRTTEAQFRAARPVPLEQLAAGDLLFFRIGGQGVAHVGIYAGDGRFVHAPQTGRPVESRPLADAYYRSRLLGAGRLY
jgi:cell wall-associated NlpC family hydrolase